MNIPKILLALVAFVAAGCAHQITFDKPAAYVVADTKVDAGLSVIIDSLTLQKKVSIRSMMTGLAHSWDAEPGDMLKQVADIELPQMFARYEVLTSYVEPAANGRTLVVELSIPEYKFEDFHAIVAVNAKTYERGRRVVSDKTYRAEGGAQGAKMFWTGAFGMKSAIRQSSLEAFKKIFGDLRTDLLLAAGR